MKLLRVRVGALKPVQGLGKRYTHTHIYIYIYMYIYIHTYIRIERTRTYALVCP